MATMLIRPNSTRLRTCTRACFFLPGAGNAHAAYQHQQRVSEVVAHYKVEEPPAGEDDGCRGSKQQAKAHRLQFFKPEIQREQQDAEAEDQAEPVRLAEHGTHAQPRVR